MKLLHIYIIRCTLLVAMFFTVSWAHAQNEEIFAVEQGQAITPNQPITATQSIVVTPGNDTEWPTNMSMGSSWDNPLVFTASTYYPSSTTTYTFVNSLRGTNNPKDGELQSDGTNVGNGYKYNQKNLPVSGGFLVFEAKQNGSLIVPIRVFANKPLYVTDGKGKAKTDIQFKDADGTTYTLLTTTLCAVSETDDVTGFVSFNVTQGEKYYVFCTGSKARFGGYVFSTETIDIDPATMKDVKSILETEPYAVLSENNTVLTFYYDDKKEQMNGMDVGPFSFNSRTERGWNDVSSNITTVVFDASMANDTTLTSTACWFSDCTYLTSIRGMEYLKTSKVKDMSFMFGGCSGLTSISGLQYLNTSNVTKMVEMFFGCYRLTSLELGNFNTENVTDMNGMFSACTGLTSLDLRSFNTANVTIMTDMFSGCYGLTSLDLSGFKTDNMESMVGMFNGCSVLKTITVGSGWVVNNTGAGGTTRDIGENMFSGCTSLKGGKGTVYDDTHTGSEYARIDNAPDAPGYFTDGSSVANFEMFSVDKSVTYVPNQPITATPSIVMTPGNDAEWMTDLDIGLTNLDTGESTEVLEFNASRYYSSSTETFTFKNAMRGTLNPRDGELTTNSETGEVNNAGSMYIPGYRNLPRTGGFIAFEALQNGSLHVPIRVTEDKSLYVVGDDGIVITDILFKDGDGHTLSLLTDPLCAVAHNYVMGFVSFNVEAGRKYYVFCNASKARFAGYVFSKEAITIAPETMANVRDILQPAPINDLELFAVDATTKVTPNVAVTATRSVRMTPGNDAEWNPRLLESSSVSLSFNANNYYPSSTSTYTFWGGLRGATSAKDGELTEGQSTGVDYDYKSKNLPHSGSYVTYESVQDGSLIIPLHVPLNKPLYVVDSNGKVNTDIQFLNDQNQAEVMLAEPLCVFSETEAVSGFLSFNVKQGEKYTIFINGGVDLRYGGYVFSTESISINPATMEKVKGILEGSLAAEHYAVLSDNNTKLTFYYDNQKAARNGMDIGPFAYLEHGFGEGQRPWHDQRESITSVVIDASMAADTALVSTGWWFYGCTNLKSVSGWENLPSKKIVDMWGTFEGCSSLSSNPAEGGPNFSKFNTDSLKRTCYVFNGCTSMTSLDLSAFNTSHITENEAMFSGCTALTTIYVGNGWDMSGVKDNWEDNMFSGCTSLVGGAGTTYDANHVGTSYAHIDGGPSNPGYLTDINASTEPTYDYNGVLTVRGSSTMDEALRTVGNEEEVIKNISSIVWNSSVELTENDLTRFNNPNMLIYTNDRNRLDENRPNVIINGNARNVVLTDTIFANGRTINGNFYCPQEFTAERISFVHNYKQRTEIGVSRGWETLVLPFNVQNITHERNGEIAPFGNDRSDKHFWLRTIGEGGLTRATGILANNAYFISMPNNEVYGAEYNLPGIVTFSARDAVVPVTQTETKEITIVTRAGEGETRTRVIVLPCFQRKPVDSSVYALNVGSPYNNFAEGSVFVAGSRDVNPFEVCTFHEGGHSPAPLYLPLLDLEGSTTGIAELRTDPVRQEGYWYDLNGRRLNTAPSGKGIYIFNGKKVVR